jgi:phage/plasmid-like protein (TIGR03299 family)
MDNVEQMAYVGAVPWHGKGRKLEPGKTIEEWQTAAGMDWELKRADVQFNPSPDGDPHYCEMPGRSVLYRSDNGRPLSVVSEGYNVVQPIEVLEFFRELTGRAGLALETAGVLRHGAIYWALARTGEAFELTTGDRTEGYVLLATSCDKSLATIARHTSVRVVCNNTLDVSINAAGGFRVCHSTQFNAAEAKDALGLDAFGMEWAEFQTNLKRMAAKPVDAPKARQFYSDLLRPPKPADDDAIAAAVKTEPTVEREPRGLDKLVESYYSAPGASPGNAFGLVQGMTHYLDHVRGKGTDKRLSSAWFGQGRIMKRKTWDAAIELAA